MKSRFWLLLLVAVGSLLMAVTAADAQVPSGERQLGKTIIEPGYDDRTGELIYIMPVLRQAWRGSEHPFLHNPPQ